MDNGYLLLVGILVCLFFLVGIYVCLIVIMMFRSDRYKKNEEGRLTDLQRRQQTTPTTETPENDTERNQPNHPQETPSFVRNDTAPAQQLSAMEKAEADVADLSIPHRWEGVYVLNSHQSADLRVTRTEGGYLIDVGANSAYRSGDPGFSVRKEVSTETIIKNDFDAFCDEMKAVEGMLTMDGFYVTDMEHVWALLKKDLRSRGGVSSAEDGAHISCFAKNPPAVTDPEQKKDPMRIPLYDRAYSSFEEEMRFLHVLGHTELSDEPIYGKSEFVAVDERNGKAYYIITCTDGRVCEATHYHTKEEIEFSEIPVRYLDERFDGINETNWTEYENIENGSDIIRKRNRRNNI